FLSLSQRLPAPIFFPIYILILCGRTYGTLRYSKFTKHYHRTSCNDSCLQSYGIPSAAQLSSSHSTPKLQLHTKDEETAHRGTIINSINVAKLQSTLPHLGKEVYSALEGCHCLKCLLSDLYVLHSVK
ncbi:unnamed protein product, partial [Ixodes persulcatus]